MADARETTWMYARPDSHAYRSPNFIRATATASAPAHSRLEGGSSSMYPEAPCWPTNGRRITDATTKGLYELLDLKLLERV